TPGIRRIAAERDVAKDAAGCAAGAEDYRSAVDAGTTGIGCVSGDRQGSAPVFDQWAVSDRSVGEERGIGQRIVVGTADLKARRLREIARDSVEAEDTTAEGADGKHIDGRVVRQRTDRRVRQARSERPPTREIADAIAVRDRYRTLRIGHIIETANEQSIDAVV